MVPIFFYLISPPSPSNLLLFCPFPFLGGCIEGANDTAALATAQQFKDVILAHDSTRPVSAAWNAPLSDLLYGWGPKVLDLQVCGCCCDPVAILRIRIYIYMF